MIDNQRLRLLALEMLDDNEGISEPTYKRLRELLEESARLLGDPSANNDLLSKVQIGENGRYFMWEDEVLAIRYDIELAQKGT